MSVIKPFKGWRPTEDIVLQLASRPYDVLNTEEARKECEGNPYSLLHVTKAEIDLPEGTRIATSKPISKLSRTSTLSKTTAGSSKIRKRNFTSMPKA